MARTGSKGGPNPGVFMSWHGKRVKLGAATVGALTAAVLAMSTTPAAASGTYSGLAYVYGTGVWDNDWDDEGLLSRSTHASSNATCLWQKILWADGLLGSTADIDGVFGTRTFDATVKWQDRFNLESDGSVGKATFGKALSFFNYHAGGTAPGQTLTLEYDAYASGRTFGVVRDVDGNYQFVDGDGNMRKAGYDYRSCT